MKGDLLIITPSRGRPVHVARLLSVVHELRRLKTHLHVCVDDDDPALEDYQRVFGQYGAEGDGLITGQRMTFTAWTNQIALKRANQYRCLASMGDDHVPRTRGFDNALVDAATRDGPAIAYPWDGVREDVPEAVVIASPIVKALGWMCQPSLSHYYVDNVWADLGRGAGCLRFLRAVAVDHAHPSTGRGSADETYRASSAAIPGDKDAYRRWRKDASAADVAVIAALRKRTLQAV